MNNDIEKRKPLNKQKCVDISMKERGMVHYDSGNDSLTFISKIHGAEHTINTGLVLISLNKNKQIVAIELLGAYKNFNIQKNILENLTRAKLNFEYHEKQKSLIINIKLYYKEHKPIIIVNNLKLDGFVNSSSFEAIACS